ncbi:hypothetical protein K4H01_22970, partial [Mycobacterium tuberculosis]|nr:hypothetical protein [Mycobacterium tuberculosis]
MPGKLLRSVLIGLLVGGLLLALMPSLRQWQLAPTTQNDTADDSPASYNAAVRRAAPAGAPLAVAARPERPAPPPPLLWRCP